MFRPCPPSVLCGCLYGAGSCSDVGPADRSTETLTSRRLGSGVAVRQAAGTAPVVTAPLLRLSANPWLMVLRLGVGVVRPPVKASDCWLPQELTVSVTWVVWTSWNLWLLMPCCCWCSTVVCWSYFSLDQMALLLLLPACIERRTATVGPAVGEASWLLTAALDLDLAMKLEVA